MGCGASAPRDAVVSDAEEAAARSGKTAPPRGAVGTDAPGAGSTFEAAAKAACRGTAVLLCGAVPQSTSTDVHNIAAAGLPDVDESRASGGACTNALLAALKHEGGASMPLATLLPRMGGLLESKGYRQRPVLGATAPDFDPAARLFSVLNPENPSGRTRALLIGINYSGQPGELKGCVTDVKNMRHYILAHGFAGGSTNLRCLTDDPKFANARPSAKNIFNQMRWLLEDAAPGDSLFFHFSGHGGQLRDESRSDGGSAEALIPVDYQSRGVIVDSLLFRLLVAALPAGVHLTALIDCCHSGSVLQLPFTAGPPGEAPGAMRRNEACEEEWLLAAAPGPGGAPPPEPRLSEVAEALEFLSPELRAGRGDRRSTIGSGMRSVDESTGDAEEGHADG